MNTDKLEEIVGKINSKNDFEDFLELLFQDYKTNGNTWENNSLDNFLEALRAYAKDVDGYYKNMGIPFNSEKPTWKNFAEILIGTIHYE